MRRIGLFLSRLSMATVLPLAPMQVQTTNLYSSRPTTGLRQSSFLRDPNSCPSTLCVIDRFVFLVCLRAPPFREILSPFLAVLFALSSVLALTFALTSPAFVLFAFALAGLAFRFIVRPSTRLICFASVQFSFPNLRNRSGWPVFKEQQ